jgi:hypothetical protein
MKILRVLVTLAILGGASVALADVKPPPSCPAEESMSLNYEVAAMMLAVGLVVLLAPIGRSRKNFSG